MALIYGPNTNLLFAGSLARAMGVSDNVLNTSTSISIYSGVAPSPATIIADWPSYNTSSSNFLIHFVPVNWSMVGYGNLILMSGAPPAVTPLHDGTATWAIIWGSSLGADSLAGSTIPIDHFLTVNVSDASGDGIVRLASTTVAVLDGPTGLLDCSIAIR